MSTASSGESARSAVVPVSVVVPCFQSQDTIARAIRSALDQTARPQEVIAVDDGSRDGTAAALDALAAGPGAGILKVVSLGTNRGAASARNAGWERAAGPYVAFLDADDLWHPEKLAVQHAFMDAHPRISASGHGHARSLREIPAIRPTGWRELSFAQLLWRNRFVTPSAMLRREVPLRFREGQRHMEDHLLWMQMAKAGYRVALLDAVLACVPKPAFGAGGLSAALLDMERAELGNYRLLRQDGDIGHATHACLAAWSAAKFARRLGIVALRRMIS